MTEAGIDSLTRREARRIALGAQGLGQARPARPGCRGVLDLADRLGLFQIDSVNVLVRAHYMPAFSRLGAYDRAHIETAAWSGAPKLFEYWGHEASLLPVALQPLLRWRMEAAARGTGTWAQVARHARENPARIVEILAEIADRGALAAADLRGAGKATGGWWGWSEGKTALEYLFWSGRLGIKTRRGAFERVYDLPERILPPEILALPTPEPADAHRDLVRTAARSLGVATSGDMAAYFRLSPETARGRVAELVESGELRPVAVEGWSASAYLWHEAALPSRATARRLLSPFDPLLWERARTERLFGFRYRLEIYTPAHKREHGYYVLPFLYKDRLAARVDLKAERGGTGCLMVLGAQIEPGHRSGEVAEALWAELRLMADWLGLERIVVSEAGEFCATLREAGATATRIAEPIAGE